MNMDNPMNYAPIYYGTGSAARKAGQLDAYRASFAANVQTARAIEEAISAHYDGMYLDRQCLRDVLYYVQDPDRVALVLANTMYWRALDGRFSRANRAWAAGIRLPDKDPDAITDTSSAYACQAHSCLLDGFVDMFRRYQAEEVKA